MAIETVEDILEELADVVGIYSEKRSFFIGEVKERIRTAVEVERKLKDASNE